MRPMAGGSGVGIVGRRVEERALLEFRLRHPVDARGPGRRSARFRTAARAGAIRRRHAHPGDRGRSQGQGSEHRVDARCSHANRRRSADQRKRLIMGAYDRRDRRRPASTPRRSPRADRAGGADRAGAARVDPGVLRIAGHGGRGQRGDSRPADGEGPCQAEHGRRGGRGRGLQERADAECHRARGAGQPGHAPRAARGARPFLRRRDQGRRSRQAQRHHPLSAADGAGGERISGGPVRGRRLRPGDLASVPRAWRQAARPGRRGGRRERRRRRLDGRPQSRLGAWRR